MKDNDIIKLIFAFIFLFVVTYVAIILVMWGHLIK